MIAILAPAKKMDFESDYLETPCERPHLFMEKTKIISDVLKSMDEDAISSLMKVSPAIGKKTWTSYKSFSNGSNKKKCRPALFTYQGDAYKGLDAQSFSTDDMLFAEDHLRILSGLYGMLSPLTLIEPYRLEMGQHLSKVHGRRLSDYWKEDITHKLNELFVKQESKILVNLSSAEYLASVDKKTLKPKILDIIFKQDKKGTLKTIGSLAKKARGMMAGFIIKKRLEEPESLKSFNGDGYDFKPDLSKDNRFVFVQKSS